MFQTVTLGSAVGNPDSGVSSDARRHQGGEGGRRTPSLIH
jgi:hypothetical protein